MKEFRTYKRSVRERRAFLRFLAFSLSGVLLFVILPFFDVFGRSFTTAVTGRFNGIQNYKTIFNNQAFLLAVKNTLRFTGVCIPLLTITGLLIAVPLSRRKDAGVIKSLYLFPLAMPTATVVIVWKLFFYKQGFLNLYLSRLGEWTGLWGEVHTDYLGGGAAFWVLVFSYIWKNTGYTVVLWLAGILGIPNALLEAAKVDGATGPQCFFRIVLPNLKGSLYTIVILSFLNSFKIYREAYLVAGAYPAKDIYLLQHLFNNWFVNMEFDKMAAAAICVGGFLFLVIMLLQYFWDKKEG
ncbi:multiple sugar transport system permease protein [Kineothrix alysoides]|uniref:Multiple sugar transport system permease protein n=1 Tax=Kineothrix alysoides TaxID=1469948 RepID=A0A4V2QAZ4_9FIRM|nr:sugar ABC transporter permease [Kineothrix alysoides]TCL54472.1 multiple sugar transport system permease protein [Kineothrix alysoides]